MIPVLLALLITAGAAPVSSACTSNVPLKRAACERKAGHPVKALEVIDDFLVKRPKDKKALKLREQLAKEVVLVDWFSEPEGATLTLDGEELGPTPITVTVDPGKHVFRFTHDGYQPLEREENAVSGTRPKLTAVLDALPGAAPVEPAPVEPREAPAPAAAAASEEPQRAPAAAVAVTTEPAPPTATTETAAKPKHSSAPLIMGTAGLFLAIGGGVLVLTSALALNARPQDGDAAVRQYVGYGLVGTGGALGVAAIIWLLVERRPGT